MHALLSDAKAHQEYLANLSDAYEHRENTEQLADIAQDLLEEEERRHRAADVRQRATELQQSCSELVALVITELDMMQKEKNKLSTRKKVNLEDTSVLFSRFHLGVSFLAPYCLSLWLLFPLSVP